MKKMILLSFAIALLSSCTNKEMSSNVLVKIGSTTLGKSDLDGYDKARSLYPIQASEYYPGQKAPITQMVETEILNSNAAHLKSSMSSTKDWHWKQQYYPAQILAIDYLPRTLGFSESELNNYYDNNKEQFKTTIQLDSTGRDSTFIRPYEEISEQIVEKLFIEKYPPDSAFLSNFSENPDDTAMIYSEWIASIKGDLSNFFMKEYFKLEYGKEYPDSLSEIYGPGKVITPEDFDVILTWIPKERREEYSSEESKRGLVEWLLKWKLFSIQAQKSGLAKTPEVKKVLDWALKIDLASNYVETELIPKLQDGFSVDTAMVTYAMYDNGATPGSNISEEDITYQIEQLYQSYTVMRLDSTLIDLRSKKGITFLQTDFKDDLNMKPSVLLHSADSLRDTGMVNEAETFYTTLSKDFLYSTEGKTALLELAKLQTDKQQYQTAIENYRKYLLLVPDDGKRCNMYFMIGFIYDEHLNRPDQAEVNYKWILKTTPDCELADDAEFMLLHLDEPMSSVEELRAEALRQGRKIDSFEENSALDSTGVETKAVN